MNASSVRALPATVTNRLNQVERRVLARVKKTSGGLSELDEMFRNSISRRTPGAVTDSVHLNYAGGKVGRQ